MTSRSTAATFLFTAVIRAPYGKLESLKSTCFIRILNKLVINQNRVLNFDYRDVPTALKGLEAGL